MWLLDKLFHGFYYVVDEKTLRKYLKDELDFSLDNRLEASANLNIYLNCEKHHIQIWNFAESNWEEEKSKGLIIYYDKEEFKTLEELYNSKLNNLPEYFKIELIDADSVFLNNYKKAHPELKIDNY
ncbi:MAG: hypothetical protein E7170_00865 [Firmicutes bacterium]|nr:hypothetical protein [Bacillota bacterium]